MGSNSQINAGPSTWRRKEKRKLRVVPRDDEDYGNGGQDGIILPLDAVSTGSYEMAYTVPLNFGENKQKLSLQVDTGSSDMWTASTSCGTSSCRSAPNYDPSGSQDTGSPPFQISYLQGQVSGPVVWDEVELGGYSVSNQAFSAATSVDKEPLGQLFSGILGLALPLNSIIAANLPPKTDNDPDGAVFASNLFSITPNTSAPLQRFFSLSLSRPESDLPKALLGIGRHPTEYLTDPKVLKYIPLIAESRGTHFWKVNVQAINVFVDGEVKPVTIGNGVNGGVFPTAVLDSGVPIILTTSRIANGIYGALGIGPANDGQYYLPCTTPLNLTVTFDDGLSIPLHPLDLTAIPHQAIDTSTCIGLIQSADSVLGVANNPIGDMVFGVPFLRSIYMVMSYYIPDPDTGVLDPDEYRKGVDPRLGLLNLTDPVRALDEFNTVRVLQRPLTDGSKGRHSPTPGGGHSVDGKKVAIPVVIGVLGFFGMCFVLFFLRWWMAKRRWKREQAAQNSFMFHDHGANMPGAAPPSSISLLSRFLGVFGAGKRGEYAPAKRGSRDDIIMSTMGTTLRNPGQDHILSEDEIRKIKFEQYMRNSYHTDSSASNYDATMVDNAEKQEGAAYGAIGEFGVRKRPMKDRLSSYQSDYRIGGSPVVDGAIDYSDPWDPQTALDWREGATGVHRSPQSSPELDHRLSHSGDYRSPDHRRSETVSVPLLSQQEHRYSPPVHYSPPAPQQPPGVDPPAPQPPVMIMLQPPSTDLAHAEEASQDMTEEGTATTSATGGMAGVGTAARGSMIDTEARFEHTRYLPGPQPYQGPR
jgi:hypothetical protein